jgi:hypothetical protein
MRRHFSIDVSASSTAKPAYVEDEITPMIPLALYGLPGVGKSELAIEYAYRYMSEYDLIWRIQAEYRMGIASALVELGEYLGLTGQPEQTHLVRQVLSELKRLRRWLLIFDNAPEPQILEQYRPGTDNGGHIVITSIYPAWGAVAGPVRVTIWDRQETVSFLLRRTRDLH